MEKQNKQKCNHNPNNPENSLKKMKKVKMIYPQLDEYFCTICHKFFEFERA